jgi:hypothetical protein
MTGSQAGGMTGQTWNAPMWRDYEERYRSDWENRFGANKSWQDFGGAFRYGWEGGSNPQFKGKNFTDVESDLSRDWPNRYNRWGDSFKGNRAEQAWNDFKDTVREGWDKARFEFKQHF